MATSYHFVVIPLLKGSRLYSVRSKSTPNKRHIADLNRASCTCPYGTIHAGGDQLCEHQKLCVEFETEQRELQEAMPISMDRARGKSAAEAYDAALARAA